MKEVVYQCPHCWFKLELKDRGGYGESFYCRKCRVDYSVSDIICPICSQQKKVIMTGAMAVHSSYCETCVSLDDFYICPLLVNGKCAIAKDEYMECTGLFLNTGQSLFHHNLSCEQIPISIKHFTFIKKGEPIVGKKLLKLLVDAINRNRWTRYLKIVPTYKIVHIS